MFDRCQRQWFYKQHFANAQSKDETRRKTYLLGKLQSVSGWSNLRREQDEYFQNSDALVRDLSFKLGAPVQKIERDGELFLVIPSDAVGVPEKLSLVRTQVYLEKTASRSELDFLARNSENDAICLRVVQFLLQAPLRNDTRLWQPSAGMPFFEKTAVQADGGIGRYQGFAARALVAPSGKIGLCVDVRSNYVRTEPLPVRLDRLNFRQQRAACLPLRTSMVRNPDRPCHLISPLWRTRRMLVGAIGRFPQDTVEAPRRDSIMLGRGIVAERLVRPFVVVEALEAAQTP